MRRVGAGALVLAVRLLFAPAEASSSLIVAKSFADLTAEADLIFVGTVQRVESRWSDPERQAIETLVTFTQLEPVRGAAGTELTLRFCGG